VEERLAKERNELETLRASSAVAVTESRNAAAAAASDRQAAEEAVRKQEKLACVAICYTRQQQHLDQSETHVHCVFNVKYFACLFVC